MLDLDLEYPVDSGPVLFLPEGLRQIICMASVSRGVTRGCGRPDLSPLEVSSWVVQSGSVLIRWCWLDHINRQTGCNASEIHGDIILVSSEILQPDNDPAGVSSRLPELKMIGPRTGSPSCLQRLPPPVWGLQLCTVCLCQF